MVIQSSNNPGAIRLVDTLVEKSTREIMLNAMNRRSLSVISASFRCGNRVLTFFLPLSVRRATDQDQDVSLMVRKHVSYSNSERQAEADCIKIVSASPDRLPSISHDPAE